MDIEEFAERIYLNLPYDPNDQQIQLIAALARFCAPASGAAETVFLLNGYAGTGKTSLTGALVKALREARVPVVLMAPTGRAAKVFGGFAGQQATTIHRRIYRGDETGFMDFTEVADNTLENAIFIVDEASMIGEGEPGRDGGNLLEDLLQYVYSGVGCRLILLGDTAQLPPVGCNRSPAMDPDKLRSYGLKVTRVTLTEVVRQRRQSGILYNATWLRKAMRLDQRPEPRLVLNRFEDAVAVPGEELEDELSSSITRHGIDQTLIITRSNKRAVQFNLAVRQRILGMEEELCRDERLMIAKNNYLWSRKVRGLDFVANGDIAVVQMIHGTESRYGFRFADVTIGLVDRDISFDCKILLDTLTSETPALEQDRYNLLYTRLLNDPDLFPAAMSMKQRMKLLKADPYLNALQVKYAYAVTCHKSQGGQWADVYVDLGYIDPEQTASLDLYRWLYTAVTRATNRLSIINPPDFLVRAKV